MKVLEIIKQLQTMPLDAEFQVEIECSGCSAMYWATPTGEVSFSLQGIVMLETMSNPRRCVECDPRIDQLELQNQKLQSYVNELKSQQPYQGGC